MDENKALPAFCMRRRTLFKTCLGTYVATAAATAHAEAPPRTFIALKTIVKISLSSLATLWEPVEFTARFTKRDGTDSIVPGMAVRLGDGAIQVFCQYCPHELCIIMLADSDQRPGTKDLLCSCHFSTFDPMKNGAYIEGPALRDTYRFQFAVMAEAVQVTGIEDEIEERLL